MSGFCSANFTASGLPTLGEVGSGEFGANSQSGLTKESFHRAIRWFGPFFSALPFGRNVEATPEEQLRRRPHVVLSGGSQHLGQESMSVSGILGGMFH